MIPEKQLSLQNSKDPFLHPFTSKAGSHTIDLLHLSDHQTCWQQKCESSDLLGDDHSPITNAPQQQGKEGHGSQGNKKQSHSTIAAGPLHQFSQDHFYIPTMLYERRVRLGQTMCTILTEGGQSWMKSLETLRGTVF